MIFSSRDSFSIVFVGGIGLLIVGIWVIFQPNKKNAEMFRDRAAKLMAEAELSKQISIHINSQTSSARGSDGSMGIRVDSVQTSITTLNTNEAEVIQQWIDPENGTLYLMLGIELAKVGL